MTRQLIVPLSSNRSAQDILLSLKPVNEGGVKAKLLRMITMVSGYLRKQNQRQSRES